MGRQDSWENPFSRNVYEGLFQDFRKSYQKNANSDPDPLFKAVTAIASVTSTMDCAKSFVKANKPNTHGIDMVELVVWMHQLSEYSFDFDLDLLISHDYWNTPPAFAEP